MNIYVTFLCRHDNGNGHFSIYLGHFPISFLPFVPMNIINALREQQAVQQEEQFDSSIVA